MALQAAPRSRTLEKHGGVASVLFFVATVSLSMPAQGNPRAEAHVHLTRADRAYTHGHFREALTEFERAYELTRGLDTLFFIGKCHQLLHEWDDAIESFDAFLKRARPSPRTVAVERLVATARVQARRQHAREPVAAQPDEPSLPPPPEAAIEPRRDALGPEAGVTAIAVAPPHVEDSVLWTALFGTYTESIDAKRVLHGYGGISLEIARGRITYIPELSADWGPWDHTWGVSAGMTLDVALTSRLGIGALVEVGNEVHGLHLGAADYYASGGAVASLYLGRWTISPFALEIRGITYHGWSFAPGLNISVAL